MKKCMLLWAVLPWLCPALHAQVWCPPGATWHYGMEPNGGHEVVEYIGDTVVGGRTAQQLASSATFFSPSSQTWEMTTAVRYTSVQDSIVFLWAEQGSTWGWDTLYVFNALPGDRWWPVHAENACQPPWGMLEVQDISTTIIAGIPLRTWCVAYLNENGEPADPGCFNVIERLGSFQGLVPPPGGCFPIEAWNPLRCYADVDIPQFETGISPTCAFIAGMDERKGRMAYKVFPNPGTNSLHIETGQIGRTEIQLRDGTGRIVLMASGAGGTLELDSSDLAPGVYIVHVTAPAGQQMVKWVKQ